MVMFGRFCQRYAGKVHPDKKFPLEQEYAPGEEEVVFFCKVLVAEEIGDFYNRRLMGDERIEPIVRELNRVHHVDESRLRRRRHEVIPREAPLARVGPRQPGHVVGTGSISQSRCSQTTRE